MDFQKEDRKQVLEHTVEAFNQMDFVTPEDRHEAARLVAQTLFSPMYKEIDLTEAKTDARFDSKLIQSLETEGISGYRILEKSDGTAELHFQVNSLEQYGRIQEQSGYAVRPVEVADYANSNVPTGGGSNGKGQNTKEIWEPPSYRAIVAETQLDTDVDPLEMQQLVDAEKDKFVRALAGSLHAPGFTVENMDRVFNVNYFCRSRQLSLPVHLLFLVTFLSHSSAVAGDVEFQDDRVVDHPVDGRCGCHWVGEDMLPLGEDQVGGDA